MKMKAKNFSPEIKQSLKLPVLDSYYLHEMHFPNIGKIFDLYMSGEIVELCGDNSRWFYLFILDANATNLSLFADTLLERHTKHYSTITSRFGIVTFSGESQNHQSVYDMSYCSHAEVKRILHKCSTTKPWWDFNSEKLFDRVTNYLKLIQQNTKIIFVSDADSLFEFENSKHREQLLNFINSFQNFRDIFKFDIIALDNAINNIPFLCQMIKKNKNCGNIYCASNSEMIKDAFNNIEIFTCNEGIIKVSMGDNLLILETPTEVLDPPKHIKNALSIKEWCKNSFPTNLKEKKMQSNEECKFESLPTASQNSLLKNRVFKITFGYPVVNIKETLFYPNPGLITVGNGALLLKFEDLIHTQKENYSIWNVTADKFEFKDYLPIEYYVKMIESYSKHALLLTNKIFSKLDKQKAEKKKKFDRLLKVAIDMNDVLSALDELTKIQCTAQTRKFILSKIHEAKSYMAFLISSMKEFILTQGVIDIKKMASNYSGIISIKKGIQKKLDLRMMQNIERFNKFDYIIDQQEKTIKECTLPKSKYDELSCFHTKLSVVELAQKHGDVLGICLLVGRGQGAVMDPSKIEIKNIYPICISVKSFIQKYEDLLDSNYSGDQLLGNFNYWSGNGIEGPNKEIINAVLPLYVNDTCWDLTYLYTKYMVGIATTLNYLGYEFGQILSMPFLVLSKAHDLVNENKLDKKWFELIESTVFKIYKKVNSAKAVVSFKQQLQNKVSNYIANPGERIKDVIPSNKLFIMQLYVAMELGDIEKFDSKTGILFAQGMIEEEARRVIRVKKNHKKVDYRLMFRLLDISIDQWVHLYVSQYFERLNVQSIEGSQEFKEEFFKKKVQKLNVVEIKAKKTEEEKINKNESNKKGNVESICGKIDWISSSVEMNTTNSKFVELCFRGYQTWGKERLMHLPKLYQHPEEIDTSIKAIGIDSKEKELCIALQNFYHHQNWMRKKAILKNEYKNPFNQKESQEFLQNIGVTLIQNRRLKEIKSSLENHSKTLEADAVEFFANNPDIYVAAGALKGTLIGKNLRSFIKRLIKGNKATNPKDKIKLLFEGKFNQICLYGDKDKKILEKSYWTASRQNCYKIFFRYSIVMSVAEWIDLFHNARCEIAIKNMYHWVSRDKLNCAN